MIFLEAFIKEKGMDKMNKVFFVFVCAVITIGSLAFASSAGAGSFCPAMGDVDDDGRVTAADARLVLRCSVGLEKKSQMMEERGNTDGDDRISAGDARLVLRRSVGLDNGFEHREKIVAGKASDCENAGLTDGKFVHLFGEFHTRYPYVVYRYLLIS